MIAGCFSTVIPLVFAFEGGLSPEKFNLTILNLIFSP